MRTSESARLDPARRLIVLRQRYGVDAVAGAEASALRLFPNLTSESVSYPDAVLRQLTSDPDCVDRNATSLFDDQAASWTGALAPTLDSIVSFIRSFVIITPAQATAIALWVAHTYAFEATDTTPYLSITSPEKRCGKSRLLEVLELLAYNPWLTGRATAAVLVRKINSEQPTLLLDESDAAFKGNKDYAEALRGLLNSGHRKGGKASLCIGQGATISYRDFSVFCPKAIAGIGDLPDTVADRSINIVLARKASGETVDRFRRRDADLVARGIRESLVSWALDNIGILIDARPNCPDDLNDRLREGWEPLLAIADLAGGEWGLNARFAAVELSGEHEADDASRTVQLLADIRSVLDAEGEARISSALLLEKLVAKDDAPWGEWSHGRPITCRGVARLLHPHRIRPKQLKIAGENVRGYERNQFEEAFCRYVPRIAIISATAATSEAQQVMADADVMLRRRSGNTAEDMADADGAGPVARVADESIDVKADDFVNQAMRWRDKAIDRNGAFGVKASP